LLTEKEKAWFFLLRGEQPKINKMIFQLITAAVYSGTWQAMRFVICPGFPVRGSFLRFFRMEIDSRHAAVAR
jgi:hypothetical protein